MARLWVSPSKPDKSETPKDVTRNQVRDDRDLADALKVREALRDLTEVDVDE